MNRLKIYLSILIVFCGLQAVSAQTNFYWREFAVNNNFSNPSNWVLDPAEISAAAPISIPPTYPQFATDNVFFTTNSTFRSLVTSQAGAITIGSLTVSAPAAFHFNFGRALNINGNIQSNGNLTITNTGVANAVNMVGTADATIDLGTTAIIQFGNTFTINKPGARVDLLSEFNRNEGFSITNAEFHANGNNIRSGIFNFTTGSFHGDGITLTTTGAFQALGTGTFFGDDMTFTVIGSGNFNVTGSGMFFANGATITMGSGAVHASNFQANNSNITTTGTGSLFGGANFSADNSTINVSIVNFTAFPVGGLTGSTLNLRGTGNNYFFHSGSLLYDCYIITNGNIRAIGGNTVRLRSVTMNSAATTNIDFNVVGAGINSIIIGDLTLNQTAGVNISLSSINPIHMALVVENLTVNTPLVTFMQSNTTASSVILTVTDLTLARRVDFWIAGAGGVNHIRTINVNGSFVFPTGCTQQSNIGTANANFPVNFNVANPINTLDAINYTNVNFGGAGLVTASEGNNSGLNRGNVLWLPQAPQDFYWVGTGNALAAAESQWENLDNWRMGSFSGTPAVCFPSAVDNVFFGGNNGANYIIQVGVNRLRTVNNITFTGPENTGQLTSGQLFIRGNADFSGARAVTTVLNFLGSDPAAEHTAKTGDNVTITAAVNFLHQGTYRLTGSFRTSNTMSHTSGNLISDGHTIVANIFNSNAISPAGSTRTLDLSGSEIIASSVALNRDGMTDYDFSDSYFNLLSSMDVTGAFNFHNISFRGNGTLRFRQVHTNTINRLRFAANGTMDAWGFTVDSLMLAPNGTYILPSAANNETARTITVNKEFLVVGGDVCDGITLRGTIAPNNTGIIQNNTGNEINIGPSTVTNVTWIDPNFPLQVPDGVDGGGNTNVAVAEDPWLSIPKAVFWIGGEGNWSDPQNWSFTSGIWDNPGCYIPGPLDTVFFDANSFSAPNQMVTVDIATINIASMFWQPEAGAMTPRFNRPAARTFNLSGSLRLAAGMTFVEGGGVQAINFTGSSTIPYSQFIESNGVTAIASNLSFNGTGRFDLIGDVHTSGTFNVAFAAGSFNTHGYNITATTITINQTAGNFRDISNSVLRATGASQAMQMVNITINDCANFLSDDTDISSNGNITINANVCGGAISFRDIISTNTGTANRSVTITVGSGGGNFRDFVNGSVNITAAANRNVTFRDAVGGPGGAGVTISGGTGTVNFRNVINNANIIVTASGGVNFEEIINANIVTFNTGAGTIDFQGNINATGNVTFTGSVPIAFEDRNITTNGNVTFSITAPVAVRDIWSNGNVSFLNTTAPVEVRSIRALNNLTGNANPANNITAERVSLGTGVTAVARTINGFVDTDTLQFWGNLVITADRAVTVNAEMTAMVGTPCDLRDVTSNISGSRSDLIFNFCNPVLYNIRLRDMNISVLDDADCDNEPQELLVYGVDLGNNTGNIRFSSDLSPDGTTILPNRYASCFPIVLDLGIGNILTFQWQRRNDAGNFVNIPESQGGTGRFLTIHEPGVFRLNADYGSACVVQFQQTVEFTNYFTWTALGSQNDWHDPMNWNPVSIPDICSFVIIPGGLSHYPILADDGPEADVIEFQFGGEVKNTHFLNYNTARVEMALNSNQWYMISAPLRSIYSGDFYIDNPNPFHDLGGRGMMVWTQLFNVPNPQNSHLEHNWTGSFNTNDIELQPGQGMAIFANPRNSNFNQQDQLTGSPFWFPKFDDFHHYYDRNGNIIGRGNYLNRTYSGRFIYESAIDNNTGLVALAHSPLVAGEHTLVGNPFMAQLDFLEFAANNPIEEEFKIASGLHPSINGAMADFVTFKRIGDTFVASDGSDVTDRRFIAPMQSFIVVPNVTGGQLFADIENHTATRPLSPANTLRSSRVQSEKSLLLVTASRGNQRSSAMLVYWSEGNRHFRPEEDSRRLFAENTRDAVVVYLLSSDGFALDINTTNDLSEIIPIGIRTAVRGNITLSFSGMEDFGNTQIFLHDSRTGQVANLSQTNTFTFYKDEAELFVDNRLYLRFESNNITTDNNNPTESSQIVVFSSAPGQISIVATSGENLGTVEITDTQGRHVLREDNITSAMHNSQGIASGVYIVRVLGETRKVIVR